LLDLSDKDVVRMVSAVEELVKKGIVYGPERDEGVFLELDFVPLFAVINLNNEMHHRVRRAQLVNAAGNPALEATTDALKGHGVNILPMFDVQKMLSAYPTAGAASK
jgi:hypothetical protein